MKISIYDNKLLEYLEENEILENTNIDYKEKLHINSSSEKKEFLADITSFANTEGGNLFFGIVEENGKPIDFPGISISDPDKLKQRIDHIIEDGIRPSIFPTVKQFLIKLENSCYVLVLNIPRSLNIPHLVSFAKTGRFYRRNSQGKYPIISPKEIEAMFYEGRIQQQEILRNFNLLVSSILEQNSRLTVKSGPKVILGIYPINFNTNRYKLDIVKLINGPNSNSVYNLLKPLGNVFGDSSINIDGVSFTYKSPGDTNIDSFLQVNKSGSIHAAKFLISRRNNPNITNLTYIEKIIIDGLQSYLKFFEQFTEDTQFEIHITLSSMKNKKIVDRFQQILGECHDNQLKLLPIYINNISSWTTMDFKPAFDTLWNGFGLSESLNFNSEGWNQQREF